MADLSVYVKYTYSPEKAKSHPAVAGYGLGKTTVTFNTWNSIIPMQIAQEVKADLERVGFHCNIEAQSYSGFLVSTLEGKTSFFELAWIEDYHDPSDFLNVLFNSNQIPMNNLVNYSNPEIDT